MSSFVLKIIAIVTMTFDHFSKVIGQVGLMTMFEGASLSQTYKVLNAMNIIGRIAFPLFAFMIAQGITKTRSIPKYFARLALFAVISEPFYYYAFCPTEPSLSGFINELSSLRFTNVFVTLALGVLAVYIYRLLEQRKPKWAFYISLPIFIAIGFVAEYIDSDYGMWGVLLIVALYFAKTNLYSMLVIIAWSIGIYAIYMQAIIHAVFAALAGVLVLLYNGKRGPSLKWLFYIYYPAHLFLLSLWYALL